VPTVFLVKGGQLVDGFPGAIPEGQLREFLAQHGIVPADIGDAVAEDEAPLDPQAQVDVLRAQIAAEPDKDELKLDLALALLQIGGVDEASLLIDGLPANLSTDDRAVRARARLAFASALKDAPAAEVLDARIAADGKDLKARHLRGVQLLLGGHDEAALAQFLEMLRIDRTFEDGLPRKALIDAFNVISDEDLVGQYRRRMASLLF
jgi:putative thioredoxin